MSALTKEQIQGLTPEQQETLGLMEFQRIQKRQQLLGQARRYRGQQWLPPLILFILFLVPTFTPTEFLTSSILVVAVILWSLIQFHAAGVNRRLNALMELLEPEKIKDLRAD